ncbi:MAG: hypothetical protein Fur0011_1990 [Candidatus Microgenomates bacterium]
MRKIIKEVKYRGSYDLLNELVEIWMPQRPQGPVIVTSVPMWEKKKRVRGYNQAELIAREVARRWSVEYYEALVRNRDTQPMYGLKKCERLENVRGAFILHPKFEVKNKTLVLIDDVWTSGATTRECVAELKRAGLKQIIVLSLAR